MMLAGVWLGGRSGWGGVGGGSFLFAGGREAGGQGAEAIFDSSYDT